MNPNTWLSGVTKDSTLTPTQRAVALALWTFMDKQGSCFPKVQTIGERAGISKRDHVRTALAALEGRGHISIVLQPNGRLSTNEYRAVDNSQRPPRKGDTTVTPLRGRRPPRKGGGQGPPAKGSRTIPIELRDQTRAGQVVENPSPHPIVTQLAHQHRLPN